MTSPGFPQSWLQLIAERSELGPAVSGVLQTIEDQLAVDEARGNQIFPPRALRYRALDLVSPEQAAVVIVGQDPYHGLVRLPDGREIPEAMGLSFSVPKGARLPPSLRNIFKELAADLGTPLQNPHGDLTHWAEQGVLLLNTVLSVRKDTPKSHDKLGWSAVTSAVLQALSRSQRGLVFILWGNSAKALREHIADNQHTVIESSHPSPIGGSCNKGFFGSRPFSRANAALTAQSRQPIEWITKSEEA